MIRVFTYLTLAGATPYEPTASDQYHDLDIADVDAVMSNNYSIAENRDGTHTVIYDTKKLYPVNGSLIILANSVNLLGTGSVGRYLGPVLYRFYQQHLPICIFSEGVAGVGKKCYLAYMLSLPERFAALATNMVQSHMNTSQMNYIGTFNFDLEIILDGVYFDIDNIAGASWNDRS